MIPPPWQCQRFSTVANNAAVIVEARVVTGDGPWYLGMVGTSQCGPRVPGLRHFFGLKFCARLAWEGRQGLVHCRWAADLLWHGSR
jgi:hypothetical protein